MNTNPTSPTERRLSPVTRRWAKRLLGLLVLTAVIFLLWPLLPAIEDRVPSPEASALLFTTTRGPLTISVTESGTIDNR